MRLAFKAVPKNGPEPYVPHVPTRRVNIALSPNGSLDIILSTNYPALDTDTLMEAQARVICG